MITASSEHLYYYDLPSRSVRRVLADLAVEETAARQVVCSPIAVSNRILCAQVEGVFEVSLEGGDSRPLTGEPVGLVTAMSATDNFVVWVNDVGRDRLILRMLPLADAPDAGRN